MDTGRGYVDVLRESLSRKERILHNIIDVTRSQTELLKAESFDVDAFDSTIDLKSGMIDELDSVDDGFEATYEEMGTWLRDHSSEYSAEIREMQNRIREITALSGQLQSLEKRNQTLMDTVVKGRNRQIGQMRRSTRQVSNYYKTMNGQIGVTGSALFNKKK